MTRPERIAVGEVSLELQRWSGSPSLLPIVLLHDGLGSVSTWHDFPARLATDTGREVIAWSRRGHGRSDSSLAPRNAGYMHDEARAVPALMDQLRLSRAHLLGHSDGGSIAGLTAAWYPERVAGLILLAPHVRVEPLTLHSIAAMGDAYAASGLRDRLKRHHADPDKLFRAWHDIWLDPGFRDWNIETVLRQIHAPALLIQGHDDEFGTMDQLDRIEAAIGDAERLELDCCGHSPHRDRRDTVIDALRTYLAERA